MGSALEVFTIFKNFALHCMIGGMVGRGRFAMVQHNQSPCTRPGFGLRFTAETWFLGAAEQPTFAAFKQLELTSVVP